MCRDKMDTLEYKVKLLESEVESFKAHLNGLSPEELQIPSACVGWSVADVIGHLAGQEHASRVRRGLEGDYSPPAGAPSVADHDEDQFAKNIFDRALATRQQFGKELVSHLNQRLDEAVEVFKSVKSEDWDKLCYWPPGPEPVRILLNQRIAELAMHAWDIRSALESEYHISDDAVKVLIEGVDRAVRRAFRPDPLMKIPLSHRFVIEGLVFLGQDIVIGVEGASVGPAGKEEPDVTFECDGETYVLIMFGRLRVMDALADGRLTFDGNPEVAVGFGRRFVGG